MISLGNSLDGTDGISQYRIFFVGCYYSDIIPLFKRRSKMFLKRFKNGFRFERQYLTDLGLPVDSDNFKFTLMNAQHTVAKINGFANWKDLLDFVGSISK